MVKLPRTFTEGFSCMHHTNEKLTRWRTGQKLGRTLYFDEVCIGMVDRPEMAEAIVVAMNAHGVETPSTKPWDACTHYPADEDKRRCGCWNWPETDSHANEARPGGGARATMSGTRTQEAPGAPEDPSEKDDALVWLNRMVETHGLDVIVRTRDELQDHRGEDRALRELLGAREDEATINAAARRINDSRVDKAPSKAGTAYVVERDCEGNRISFDEATGTDERPDDDCATWEVYSGGDADEMLAECPNPEAAIKLVAALNEPRTDYPRIEPVLKEATVRPFVSARSIYGGGKPEDFVTLGVEVPFRQDSGEHAAAFDALKALLEDDARTAKADSNG